MQALILAGGGGTRLRPLTSTVPKPVVRLVDRPFIVYMLEWLAGHDVDDVILACGFMADGVREVLGDGSALGMRLRYVEEPEPLGTGGALKYAEDLLDERFFMLNGDLLTDVDLTAQLAQHDATGARATVALIGVEDPSAFGLVRQHDDGSVKEFLEKPGPHEIDTNLVNAGAYVLEREVLDAMAPAGSKISIEREVFPALVGDGLYGHATSGYWLDIGTPERYLQATADILKGRLATATEPRAHGAGATVAATAVICGPTVLGSGVWIDADVRVDSSVLLDRVMVGARSTIDSSILSHGVEVGEDCHIEGGVVIGEGAKIGPGNALSAGARIFPGVRLPRMTRTSS